MHIRVDYLLEKYKYNDQKHVQVFDLCTFCETMERLDKSVPMQERKQVYINCSGIDWICHARHDVHKTFQVPWNQYTLMPPEEYCSIMMDAMTSMEPRVAIQTINSFNKELKREQPHMMNTIHAVEELIFSCYKPMQVIMDTLPVPPVGKEYVKEPVDPMNLSPPHANLRPKFKECWVSDCSCTDKCLDPETEACTQCGNTHLKLAMEALENCDLKPKMPTWETVLNFCEEEKVLLEGMKDNCCERQTGLNDLRCQTLVSKTCLEILTHLSSLTGIKNPCEFCCNLKRSSPDRIIDCTGVKKVCTFKYEFFKEWPVGLVREKAYNDKILNCSTRAQYRDLLNQIFSLKYVERAMACKDILDSDLLAVNPHLAPIIRQYNCILYRYYWPYAIDKELLDLPTDECLSDSSE